MEISITMLDGSHILAVHPEDTVGSLKKHIQAKLGVSPDRQRLMFENRTLLSDDSKSISSYGVRAGSQVFLLVTEPVVIQVFLKNEKGQTSTYDISPGETVSDFKQKVQTREGTPVSQQRLIHEGREMMSGKLEDFNVKALSTIYLTFRLRGG